MRLYFEEYAHFVKGYKNAAIYDTKNNKVYAMDDYGKQIVERMLNGEEIFEGIEKEYLEKLKKLKLITEIDNNSNEKIDIPNAKLVYAWLELTEACNLKCVHCYGQFGQPKIDKKHNLKTEKWKEIINKLIQYECRDIQLIGGEPMAYRDFYEILEYAHIQGMKRIDVFTNGTFIDENSIKIFKKTGASIRVSVYGHNARIHDGITKQEGSFEANKRGLQLLKANNIPTSIAVVVMKENEKYVKNIKDYIISLGHKYNGYDVIRPSCISDKMNHSITDISLLNSRYNTKPEFWTSRSSFIENHFYNSCWNGKIAITSKGNILPCIFARDEIIGNINTNTEDELKEKIIHAWRKTKEDVDTCKDCEFRYCCHDCRPLAKAIYGNINSKYPRCCYNPYQGIWKKLEECTAELNKD